MLKLALFSVFGGAIAATYALFSGSALATVLAVGLLLVGTEIALLQRAAGGFTAAVIPVLAVNSVLLSSIFLWDSIRAESIVSYRFQVTEAEHIQAAIIGIVFSAAYTVGALIAGPRATSVSLTKLGDSFRIPNGPLVITGYAGIGLTIYARQGALLEGRYLDAPGPEWAVGVSNAVAPLAMLLLCIAAARPGRGRGLAAIGVGIWALILFGRASRTIAALPGLLLFAQSFASGKKIGVSSLAFATGATIFLLQLPLVGRANPDGVGIFPLSAQLFTRTGEVFDEFSLGALLGNILFSEPLTAVVANRDIPMHAFWVSINPAPGSLAGWPEIKPSLRIIKSTPYNALGELGAHGWVALIIVAFAVGFLLALSTRLATNLRGVYGMAAALFVMGVTSFFSVSILQYNLRSSVRLIWYILAGLAALWVASVATRQSRTPPPAFNRYPLEKQGTSEPPVT